MKVRVKANFGRLAAVSVMHADSSSQVQVSYLFGC